MELLNTIFENQIVTAVICSVVGSAIFYYLLKWVGMIKKISIYFQNKNALSNYKKILLDDCSNLIVVGRKKGFSLQDVYVNLDVLPSDLMQTKKRENREEPSSYVLLGGPGAGKSTKVKNEIIQSIEYSYYDIIPFFIRLKEYDASQPLFEFIVSKLEQFKFTDANEFVKKQLINTRSLCVLDGLDEVRPNLKEKICKEINVFYKKYFLKYGRLIVTCRKEAYRDLPLDIQDIWEVRPLTDEQIKRFADRWPIDYPKDKSSETFIKELYLSPRIMDLTRSPLLLVGGLMQYSESNLGIPEERFEYLQTMARWLIVDWATAQSHLPDRYRNVYERILTSLAYKMHQRNISEITISEAEQFIATLLPNFGYREEEAAIILNNISIKTGILNREGSSTFFSQFGLQEYFVSKEMLCQVNIDIPKLKPLTWWRESILLYAAQQKDPTEILNSLFDIDPLLAIAAVSECPTPSINMLNKSMQICLMNIDNGNTAVKDVLIPFVRKVKDDIELSFYPELEKRFTASKIIAEIVAVSLASAGTAKSVEILKHHTEVWAMLLNTSGYLSSSFENLLVDWIQNGEDSDSIKAADLLSSRLTSDRMLQLLNILPTLNKKKKDHLSQLILKHIVYDRPFHYYSYDEEISEVSIITQLVPNILNYRQFIKNIDKETDNYDLKYKSNKILNIILIIFSLQNIEKSDSNQLAKTYTYGIFWQNNKNSLFFFFFSVLALFIPLIKIPFLSLILISVFSITSIMLYVGAGLSVPFPRTYKSYRNSSFDVFWFFILGGIVSLFAFDCFNTPTPNLEQICIGAFSVLLSLLAILNSSVYCLKKVLESKQIKDSQSFILSNFKALVSIMVIITILTYSIGLYYTFLPKSTIFIILIIIYLLTICVSAFNTFRCWKKVKKAIGRSIRDFEMVEDYCYKKNKQFFKRDLFNRRTYI
jgi:hypothetical protein